MRLTLSLTALLLGVCLAPLAACRAIAGDGMAANAEDEDASITAWRSATIAGIPAQRFVWLRTGQLLVGADEFRVDAGSQPPRGVALLGGQPVESPGGAAACAIDARGYWLTAAHCVQRGPLLIAMSDGRELRAWPARVVWNG